MSGYGIFSMNARVADQNRLASLGAFPKDACIARTASAGSSLL
jgi:hypothetical protein